jgi:Protein of unknown function (DUF2577)
MMKQQRFEGDGAARLIQLMRHHGYNKDVDVEFATVTSVPPNVKLKLDNSKLELNNNDVVATDKFASTSINVGDRVALLSFKNGQLYLILDKVVTY